VADNRLFLVHRPTGAVLFLGKRLGINWHHDEPLDIDAFYRQCAAEGWVVTRMTLCWRWKTPAARLGVTIGGSTRLGRVGLTLNERDAAVEHFIEERRQQALEMIERMRAEP
jgi:hypothetical protein